MYNYADRCKGADANQAVINDEGCAATNSIPMVMASMMNWMISSSMLMKHSTQMAMALLTSLTTHHLMPLALKRFLKKTAVEDIYAILASLSWWIRCIARCQAQRANCWVDSVFAEGNYADEMTEQNMNSSAVPEIAESQQWEEGGSTGQKQPMGRSLTMTKHPNHGTFTSNESLVWSDELWNSINRMIQSSS